MQHIEFKIKRLGILAVLVCGLSTVALAQSSVAPTRSPNAPAAPLPPAGPKPAPLGSITTPAPNSAPESADIAPAEAAAAKNQLPSGIAPLPEGEAIPSAAANISGAELPPMPEVTETSIAASSAAANAIPNNAAPSMPPALPAALPAPLTVIPVMQAEPAPETTSLPEINVEKPKPKTWLTKLAPSYIPVQTNFNYKREVLPEQIYNTSYSRENRHLPKRITRDDYANLLFDSVAKNDVNATRALLNAGTGINSTNPYGETPLALARRTGAVDVAALLESRGARE